MPVFLFVSFNLSGQIDRNFFEESDSLSTLDRIYYDPPITIADSTYTNFPEITDMPADSVQVDNESAKKKKSMIDSEVLYNSKDSIYMQSDKIYLYGEASVNYQDINLTAHYIELDLENKTVFALGSRDSLGVEFGLPIFKDKSGEYTMREVRYNFESKKALIKHVVTQQGEGYVVSEISKKNSDDSFFIKDGRYTTCDHHDHPHFYLNITKGKMIPGDKTISGPAYLVVEDVKLPLAVPFAFVPMTKPYSSGFLMPSYGEESNRGFFLSNGGYYFAFNDYIDATLTGDYYSNTSWGLRLSSQYKWRYKFSGNLNIQRITNVTSEKGLPDYRQSKDFSLTMSHRQDPKANPYSNLSISINYSTSSFDQNNVGSVINPEVLAQNTKRSNISYSYRFPKAPFNISANFMHSQNSRDTTIDLTIPNLTVNMNRIYPFKSKNKIGSKESWYEKISITYSGSFQNSIRSKEYELMNQSLSKDWKNGVKHSIPVSMNLKALKYFTVTPNFTYTERWYFKSIMQDWDSQTNKVINSDTITGFNRVFDYSYGISTSTKLYGFYRPIRAIFGDKINAIRHVMTPTVSLSYRPDFGKPKYGFYDWYEYYNPSTGEVVRRDYSFYSNEVYGVPSRGESGSLSYSLGNTLEMKLKTDKDTTGFKKINLIESLNLSSSYNFLADSMNMSRIQMSGRTKLFGTGISFGATFNPYALDTVLRGNTYMAQEVNRYQWNSKGGLVRFESANLSFGLNFDNKNFKKKNESKNRNNNQNNNPPPDTDDENDEESQSGSTKNTIIQEEGDEGYVKFEMPWSISINYNMRYIQENDMAKFNRDKMNYGHKMTADINISGKLSLTKKWDLSMSTGYNIERKEISHTNIRISRDLHCWSMSMNLVPIGRYKSFFFIIGVNSSMLRDLKYEKRSSPRDNVRW